MIWLNIHDTSSLYSLLFNCMSIVYFIWNCTCLRIYFIVNKMWKFLLVYHEMFLYWNNEYCFQYLKYNSFSYGKRKQYNLTLENVIWLFFINIVEYIPRKILWFMKSQMLNYDKWNTIIYCKHIKTKKKIVLIICNTYYIYHIY